MGDKFDPALHYGHLGKIFYSTETESWSFSRTLNPGPSISYTGATKTVIESPKHNPSSKLFGPYGRPPNPNSIPEAHPDLGVHWSSIRKDSSHNLPLSDSPISTLLDLGFASVLGIEGSSHIPIAAAVTGECRNVISLRVVVEDTVELPLEESTVLVPSIGNEETTEWSTQGAQIQQICFSRPFEDDDQATYMAARLLESTAVFRPLYHHNPGHMQLRHDDPAMIPSSLRNSRLDANPVTEISNSDTGGFPHADVAFNPWYQKQLAIIDTMGNWSIWEIKTRRKRRTADGFARLCHKGSLSTPDQMNADGSEDDGWGSIQYVDFSTILVANRKSVMLFQIEGENVRSRAIQLRMGRQPEWVIDVKKNIQNLSQFFILTSYRLLHFDLKTATLDEDGQKLPLESSLVRRHFRDANDTTLMLSDLLIRDNLYLALYSRVTELLQIFPCPLVNDPETEPFVGPDAFYLHLQSALKDSLNKRFRCMTLLFKEVDHSPAPGTTLHNPDMSLIKLFWIDSSLAVHETLFKGLRQSLQEEQDTGMEIENGLKDRHILRASEHHLNIPSHEVDVDFVVNDWDESTRTPRVMEQSTDLTSTYEDLEWTLNWTPIYQLALEDIAGCAAQAELERSRPTFDHIIGNLESEIIGGVENWHTSQSMLEITGGRPVSNDIDQNAYDLKRLVSTVLQETQDPEIDHPFMILPLQFSKMFPGMPVVSQEKQSSLDFLETYDRLVELWLANIPHDIPNPTRRMKERIIRGIALDILLARLIRISKERKVVEPSQPDGSTSATLAGSALPEAKGPASSQLPSSQITAFYDGSSQPAPEEERSSTAAYSSLSAFTTFKKPPRPLPRNITNMLSQWEVGTDPSAYKWRKVSSAEEAQELSRRRKKRLQRSQLSQLSSQLSQQTPTITASPLPPTPSAPSIRTWGSQPDQRLPLASSQPSIGDFPMSQIERGLFGTREVRKSLKVKKKRKGGF
ncbi:hypothetical protein N7466_003422 [Penicillium verhagenii]|uniref:uncharacterized protein n=1 Tax=Penicillium verhagenii TaxID=1562060 RepID=UPI0025453832|nr:uncharacterized protein N7466_003422 [Penicillium verhagenii]KAJ5936972.1 hypothetical protein N7466_003422 [Penicillium verhagenii]